MGTREFTERPEGTLHSRYATADTNSVLVAAAVAGKGPRVLTELMLCNNTAVAKHFRLYNKATAPTVGTDVPVIRITLQASQTLVVPNTCGFGPFDLGLGYGCTGLIGDADVTALVANDITVNLRYI